MQLLLLIENQIQLKSEWIDLFESLPQLIFLNCLKLYTEKLKTRYYRNIEDNLATTSVIKNQVTGLFHFPMQYILKFKVAASRKVQCEQS